MMIVVLSGEGPSDLGSCVNGQGECLINDFNHGPMTYFIDKELETLLGFSLLEITPDRYIFVSKSELIRLTSAKRQNRASMSLLGKKRPEIETGYFYLNALILGNRAAELAIEHEDPAVIAVLFRDSDGTRSADLSLWQDKVNSIRHGFDISAIGERGVAMVPKPKSESWMLCVLRDGYEHCARLEDLSGNDNVPDSAKRQLEEALGSNASTSEQIHHLEQSGIDTARLAAQMPSYEAFQLSLTAAYRLAAQV
ncbi:hypothetical protein [Serratia marcescens]|uniref:hypothetical protein n=2 Tax=Enterobacterales TaxID=91347 RepID=UPI001BD50AEF|nr:hypothetical protein [Serratia marcescens]HEJ0351034.1 hypothetical protein [Klebsiella oxytoca]